MASPPIVQVFDNDKDKESRDIEECLRKIDSLFEDGIFAGEEDTVVEKEATATEEEIIAFCRESLAAYKVPRLVQFVSEVPKTSTGKIMRRMRIPLPKPQALAASTSPRLVLTIEPRSSSVV